jgi:hypothetical protein
MTADASAKTAIKLLRKLARASRAIVDCDAQNPNSSDGCIVFENDKHYATLKAALKSAEAYLSALPAEPN